jgi:hypothetical protein
MDNYEILSDLYDIIANLDCGDVFEAGTGLDKLAKKLEDAG